MSRLLFQLLTALIIAASAVADEVPLHTRIDRLIAAAELGPVAAQCDDATFLRRATLALAGRIPTRTEVALFLDDSTAEKRQSKVDALLQSAEFPRHMAVTLELMLMERRSGTHVKTSEFRQYLEASVRQKKSWLEIACEVLSVNGSDTHRAAAGFLLQRNVEPHLLTRDTGRIFFGMDLQCAQCHDHPLIDDYRQDDYYGLNAFFVRSALFQPDKKKPASISEAAAGEASFKSVFTDREGNMRPRIPGGSELTGAKLQPHERYRVFPAKNVRAVPVDSRLSRLAQTLRDVPSEPFDRNIANRLWAHMFGRGLVHPVDLHHSSNPPTHPELLALLAAEFRRHNHDIAWLLREMALSETWQRSFKRPDGVPTQKQLPPAQEKSAERAKAQFALADEHDRRYGQLLEKVDTAVADAKAIFDAERAAAKKVEEAITPRNAAQAKFDAAKTRSLQAQQALAALQESSASVASCAELLHDNALTELMAELTAITKKQKAMLPQLEAAMSAEQNKLDDAEAKLNAAATAAEPAIRATLPIDREIRELRRAAYEQRLQAQAQRTAAEAATTRQQQVSTIRQLAELSETAQQLTAQLSHREGTTNTLRKQHENANADFSDALLEHQRQQTDMANRDARLQRQQALVAALIDQPNAIESSITTITELSAALPEISDDGQVRGDLQNALIAARRNLQESQRVLAEEQKTYAASCAAEATARTTLQQTRRQADRFQKQLQQARQSQEQLQKQLADAMQRRSILADEAAETAIDRFAAARLTALTPEQLAWSLLTATGQTERQRRATAAKLDKDKPLSEEQKNDPQVLQERARQIDAATRTALETSVARFAALYGASAGQPQDQFFATVDQSLFLANGGEIRGWLVPSAGNLTDRVNRIEDPVDAARGGAGSEYLSRRCRTHRTARHLRALIDRQGRTWHSRAPLRGFCRFRVWRSRSLRRLAGTCQISPATRRAPGR